MLWPCFNLHSHILFHDMITTAVRLSTIIADRCVAVAASTAPTAYADDERLCPFFGYQPFLNVGGLISDVAAISRPANAFRISFVSGNASFWQRLNWAA